MRFPWPPGVDAVGDCLVTSTMHRTAARILTVLVLAVALVGQQTNAARAFDPGVHIVMPASKILEYGLATGASAGATAAQAATAASALGAAAVGVGAAGVGIAGGAAFDAIDDHFGDTNGLIAVGAKGLQAVLPGGAGSEIVWDWISGEDPDPDGAALGAFAYPVTINSGPTGGSPGGSWLHYSWNITLPEGYDKATQPTIWAVSTCPDGSEPNVSSTLIVGGANREPGYTADVTSPACMGVLVDGAWTNYPEVRWVQDDNLSGAIDDGDSTVYDTEASSEPVERFIETQGQCQDLAGNVQPVASKSAGYYLPDPPPSFVPVVCPDGMLLAQLKVLRTGEGIADVPVLDPYELPAPLLDPVNPDADCLAAGCEVELVKVLPDQSVLPCAASDVYCAGWVDAPEGKFECHWKHPDGVTVPQVLPLADCYPLEDVDKDPDTQLELGPYPDPVPEGMAPDLIPGTPGLPGLVEEPCAQQSWVDAMTLSGMAAAVGCAIKWAGVPTDTAVRTQIDLTKAELDTRVPFAYADLVGPVITAIPESVIAGACAGDIWDLTPRDIRPGYDSVRERHGAGHLAMPCQPPGWWDPVRMLLVSMVIVGTAWGLWNIAGSAVNGPTDGGGGGND